MGHFLKNSDFFRLLILKKNLEEMTNFEIFFSGFLFVLRIALFVNNHRCRLQMCIIIPEFV